MPKYLNGALPELFVSSYFLGFSTKTNTSNNCVTFTSMNNSYISKVIAMTTNCYSFQKISNDALL